jgi:hypothetical protein
MIWVSRSRERGESGSGGRREAVRKASRACRGRNMGTAKPRTAIAVARREVILMKRV